MSLRLMLLMKAAPAWVQMYARIVLVLADKGYRGALATL